MRTYDYILAMKEENQVMEVESEEDLDFSSDESIDFNSPEKTSFISRIICREEGSNQVNAMDILFQVQKLLELLQ